jgi:hypothetical protein
MAGGLVEDPKPLNKGRTMTRPKQNDQPIAVTKQELLRLLSEEDALKPLVQTLLQEVLEAEMDESLPADWATAAGTTAARW